MALVLCFCALPSVKVLSISNRKNLSEKIYSGRGCEGFVISYTHSVNKGRIHDFYVIRDEKISLARSVFVSYGAGITEPEEIAGSVFTVRSDGYELSLKNMTMSEFLLAVGVIAEHSVLFCSKNQAKSSDFEDLCNLKREYFLKDYFPVQTSLVFKIKRVSIFDFLKTKSLR